MSLLVAPKPKRIQSPRTENEESKGDLWGFTTEDPSLEVKRIWVSEEFIPVDIPIRHTPKLKDSFAGEPFSPARFAGEPFSPTRKPSPPIRSQNPFEAEKPEMDVPCFQASHEVDLISPLFEDVRSPASALDEDHDPVVDDADQDDLYPHDHLADIPHHHSTNNHNHNTDTTHSAHYGCDGELVDDCDEDDNQYYDADPPPPPPAPSSRVPPYANSAFSPPEDSADAYHYPHTTPFAADVYAVDDDVGYGPKFFLQIATAPVTPSYKRKRGETISRSLPDIRFPDYLRHTVHPHPYHSQNAPPSHHHHHAAVYHSHTCTRSRTTTQHSMHHTMTTTTTTTTHTTVLTPTKRASSSSPFKLISSAHYSTPPALSLLTSALLSHRTARHRRCRSGQLGGLMENVHETDGGSGSGGLVSPTTQRYRHTVS